MVLVPSPFLPHPPNHWWWSGGIYTCVSELVICGPRRATVPDTLPTTHYQGHCSLVGLLRLPAMTPTACYQGHCSLAGPTRLPCHVANRLLSGALFAG
ncbi:hypothetical protein GW17_00009339, partial [Ensete ventricosum]